MARNSGYEVLVDELTVLRKIGELTDPITGSVVGIQQGQGKIYFRGEVIPADAVSPIMIEALEDEDHPSHESTKRKLKKVSKGASEDLSVRLGLPFAAYDEMSQDEILAVMVNLPSVTIQSIKAYEARNDERPAIMNYSIGFAEDPDGRLEGRVGSDLDEENSGDEDKPTAVIQTREVTDDAIQRGEGITGTGDPDVAPGTAAGESPSNGPASPRRNRRKRNVQAKSSGGTTTAGSDDSGSGSGDES